jgi:3-methyl-2-oxobutanoate hydroxymethyltransferase
MPFLTYHGSLDRTMEAAGRIMQEGLAKAVKMEGGTEIAGTLAALTAAGVPVMGHLGLTPQSVHQIGGYKVQGKTADQARKLVEDAVALEQAGVFAIVLELVTEEIAEMVTKKVSVPTIGIGAGAGCDGQVLVYHDLLNYGPDSAPKRMVKTYANLGESVRTGIAQYVQEVKTRQFPTPNHAFRADRELAVKLYGSN